MAYYTSSYIFNNSTTSTAALMVWRAVSLELEHKQLPMSLEDLMAASDLSEDYINSLFRQSYYQRYYGFRRFDTIEEFREWATSTGVLYNPELHDPKPGEIEEDLPEADEEDEETDETEE